MLVADLDGHKNILPSEEEIAFEGAMVVTPANATLVKDLTLRVPRGTNLLVTGPNGSGAPALPCCRRLRHAACNHHRNS